MSDSNGESSIPPHAPRWMADLLGRIDLILDLHRDCLEEQSRLREEQSVLRAMIADNRERIGRLEVHLGMSSDTERPPPEPAMQGGE